MGDLILIAVTKITVSVTNKLTQSVCVQKSWCSTTSLRALSYKDHLRSALLVGGKPVKSSERDLYIVSKVELIRLL